MFSRQAPVGRDITPSFHNPQFASSNRSVAGSLSRSPSDHASFSPSMTLYELIVDVINGVIPSNRLALSIHVLAYPGRHGIKFINNHLGETRGIAQSCLLNIVYT